MIMIYGCMLMQHGVEAACFQDVTDSMDGVELADSVCWDAHKMMGLPLICSVFLTKNKAVLRSVCTHGDSALLLIP